MIEEADLDELTAFAHLLADTAASAIKPYFRAHGTIDNKHESGYDPVTQADRHAEEAMRELIDQTYPAHGILGEEHGHKPADGVSLTWVLDPIDGTRSFITGFPTWGTLIALNDGSGPIIGIMDQPFTGERFVGSPRGAYLGDERLRTRPCASLDDAVLYATTPDMFITPAEREAFRRAEDQVRLRRFGGDCYSYVMLAMGHVDLVIEAAMQPYDIQALIPIVENAGGIVTNWEGDSANDGGQILAAGDPDMHTAALALLST